MGEDAGLEVEGLSFVDRSDRFVIDPDGDEPAIGQGDDVLGDLRRAVDVLFIADRAGVIQPVEEDTPLEEGIPPERKPSEAEAAVAERVERFGVAVPVGAFPGEKPVRIHVLPLYRSRHQAFDEVALQAEEHRKRNDHGDERPGGQQVPVLSPGPDHRRQALGEDRDISRSAQEDQGDQQVVPYPEELEDRKRGDRGNGEGQDEAGEDDDLPCPVKVGGFEDAAWNRGDVVV